MEAKGILLERIEELIYDKFINVKKRYLLNKEYGLVSVYEYEIKELMHDAIELYKELGEK